jgi:low affinity Fe/Cu permease
MTQSNNSERPRVLKSAAGRDVTNEVSPAPTEEPCHNPDWFGQFAAKASALLGTKWAFAIAALVIVVWALMGPFFHYSDTWQLVINTGTTIVTFLMVFLIQNTQNRDARAINLKLNELIRAIDAARDQMIDIESSSDLELNELQARYEKIKADIVAETAAEVAAEVKAKQ